MKECKQIENLLPLYLDDSLSGADQKAVEEHLTSCSDCAQTLAQLRKTHSMTADLSDVEPPAWFKQKIMAGVCEQAEKKTLFHKLFYPPKIKIPVQIFATICIAVLTVYIYRAGEDQMKKVVTSSIESPVMEAQKKQQPQRELQSKADSVMPTEEAVKSADKMALPKSAAPERDWASAPSAAKDANEQITTAAAPPADRSANDQVGSSRKAESMMAAEKMDATKSAPAAKPAATDEVVHRDGSVKAAKSVMMPESRLEKKKQNDVLNAAMKGGQAPKAQDMIKQNRVVLKVADLDDGIIEVEKLLVKYGAKNISRQTAQSKTTLTVRLEKQKMKEFTAQLKTVGQIQYQDALDGHQEEEITFVIDIVSP